DEVRIRFGNPVRACCGAGSHEDGDNLSIAATAVKILQVQRIVPSLIDVSGVESHRADLEFDGHDDVAGKHYSINAVADTRDGELEEEMSVSAAQRRLQQLDLFKPRGLLFLGVV